MGIPVSSRNEIDEQCHSSVSSNDTNTACTDERQFSAACLALPSWSILSQTSTSRNTQNPECLLSLCVAKHITSSSSASNTTSFVSPIAASTSSHTLKIFDSQTLALHQSIPVHTDAITSLSFVDELSMLLTSSKDSSCKLTDIRTPPAITAINLQCRIPALSSASNGRIIAVGAECGDVILWDVRSMRSRLGTLDELHSEEVSDLQFHRIHRSTLLSASLDCLVAKFNLNASSMDDALLSVYSTRQCVRSIGTFGDTHQFLYCLSEIETISLFNIDSDDEIACMSQYCADLSSSTMSTRYIVGCHYDVSSQRLCIISGNYHGDLLASFINQYGAIQPALTLCNGHTSGVRAISSIANRIYSAGEDSRLICWHSQTNTNHR